MIDDFLQILSENVPLSRENLDRIRTFYEKDRDHMVETVLETKLVFESQILEALSQVYDMDYVETLTGKQADTADSGWIKNISKQYLKESCMVPIFTGKETGVIAINDPSNLSLIDDMAALLNLEQYKIVLSPKAAILSAVNILYEHSRESTRQIVEDIEDNGSLVIEDIERTADLLDDTSDAPVIRLVNHMISQGVKAGASDIHVEPFQEDLKVRYRIDGILYEMLSPPKTVQASLISRIKVMAKMNIAEKRVPQDGRAQVRLGNQEIDIRISTVPTSFGERLVMRLLNKSGYFLELSEFGLSKENYTRINQSIRKNNGIVLVTGPTGSGKTTTLYAGLSEINSPDKNIITIEDPIEYNLEGIGQIQVNPKTGLTFAKGLRSIVRQDPDIILIGEIRDLETAEIAIQSALTGHLVFSTLHTNDSAGAITRLVDLGVEPYLIASSVNTVIAQRLIRVLCNECKQPYTLGPSEIQSLNGDAQLYVGKEIFKPKGCPKCFQTGFSGREAIFEIMDMTDELKSLVLTTSDANQIKKAALKNNTKTLRKDGVSKVLKGTTSIGEVLRVTQE